MIVNILVVPTSFDKMSNEEAQETLMRMLRYTRNSYLKSCDWTQVSDSPLSSEEALAWASYRQQLRDLPNSITDIDLSGMVEFPDPPQV